METFNFYKDEKHTIWYRGRFQIEAKGYKEAIAKVKEMENDPMKYDEVDIRWEDLPETLEGLTPEDNQGYSTTEIYSEDKTGDLIYSNGLGVDPIKI
jgi:hypothetical protein